jgi:two-component sensor histidine kinase
LMPRFSIVRRLSLLVTVLVVSGTFVVVTVQMVGRYQATLRVVENDREQIEHNMVPVLSYLVWVLNLDQSSRIADGIREIPSVAGVTIDLAEGGRLYHWVSENRNDLDGGDSVTWDLQYTRGDEVIDMGVLTVVFMNPWRFAATETHLYAQIVPTVVLSTFVLFAALFLFRTEISRPLSKLQGDLDSLDLMRELPEWWASARDGDLSRETAKVRAVIGNSASRVFTAMEERRETELRLEKWLAEKDVLLREIHHRVKNNLQLVISMLSLQRRSITEPAAQLALEDSEHRVFSMSLVHELLYRGDDLGSIPFNEYLRDLAQTMVGVVDRPDLGITTSFDMERDHQVSLDTAIPLGIIATEILTNAVKHAFPDGRVGAITISTRFPGGDRFIMIICDNGCGMSLPGRDGKKSLGMELIHSLCDQINAELSLTSGPEGTCFSLTIPSSA